MPPGASGVERNRGPASARPRSGLSDSGRGSRTSVEGRANPHAPPPPWRAGSPRHLATPRLDLALGAPGIAGQVRPEAFVHAAVIVYFLPQRDRLLKRSASLLQRRIERHRPLERPRREGRLEETEMGEPFDVPDPRGLAEAERAVRP